MPPAPGLVARASRTGSGIGPLSGVPGQHGETATDFAIHAVQVECRYEREHRIATGRSK